ncbi:uncharacterized protein TNCV_4179411 [Trichonephila clavipes]|nr:uncharacterized protein TNCV_4179411 [Trichonephila clavipes]
MKCFLTGWEVSLRLAIASASSVDTGDETWCFEYDSETKRSRAECQSENSSQTKKEGKFHPKSKQCLLHSSMLREFNKEFVPTGQTITDSINETKVHGGLIREEDLNKNFKNSWKVEEVEEPIVKNKERLICEEHYANTHFRTKEGKYVVSMPLKKEPSCLGNSKDIALKRLGSLWNRLARNEIYLNLYREFLRDYETGSYEGSD